MRKKTIYLPDELKRRVEREAAMRGTSETDAIRAVLDAGLRRPTPTAGIVDAEPLAHRDGELLEGFGDA